MAEDDAAHGNAISRLTFNADGRLLASASHDGTVKLWTVAADGTLAARQTFEGHEDLVHGLAFSSDGRTLATASFDGRAGLFDVGVEADARFFAPFDGKDVNVVQFDPASNRLLTGGDNRVSLWDVTERPPALVRTFPETPAEILWAALSPDGEWMAQVGRGVVDLYSTADGQLVHRLVGHESTVYRAVFSPDGRQLATVSSDATVRLWDVSTATELWTLALPANRYPPEPLWDFDFRCTPEGCWIAVPLARGKLALYDLGPYAR